jgi:hypothetical protein
MTFRVDFGNVTSRKSRLGHLKVAPMWIGIIVLCTFGAAALVSAFFAIRCAFHGQWHMTIGLSVPAVVIGGALCVIVGPTIWLELAGNPELDDLPGEARMLTGSELADLYSGNTVEGRYYEDGAWQLFTESYEPTGELAGAGGPPDDPTRHSWRGEWKVEGDEICFNYDAEFSCGAVYRLGEDYVAVNHRDEIDNRFQLAAPEPEEAADAS